MRSHPPAACLLRAALLGLAFCLLPRGAHPQTCTTRTECVDKGLTDPSKLGRPVIGFRLLGDTVHEQNQELLVHFGDDAGLDQGSVSVTLSPGILMGGRGWQWNKAYTGAWFTSTVALALGRNVVHARVCDTSGRCSADSMSTYYALPPPPPSRAAATLRNVYNADSRNLAGCAGCSSLCSSTPPRST